MINWEKCFKGFVWPVELKKDNLEKFTYRITHRFTEGAWYGFGPANNAYSCQIYNQKSLKPFGPIAISSGSSPQQAYKKALKIAKSKSSWLLRR